MEYNDTRENVRKLYSFRKRETILTDSWNAAGCPGTVIKRCVAVGNT